MSHGENFDRAFYHILCIINILASFVNPIHKTFTMTLLIIFGNDCFISFSVHSVDGNSLSIDSVSRRHIGAYFCIASNGVPPSISKRIELRVQCETTLNQHLVYLVEQNIQSLRSCSIAALQLSLSSFVVKDIFFSGYDLFSV